MIEPRAAELLREVFEKMSGGAKMISFSGNTDCCQPLEASYARGRDYSRWHAIRLVVHAAAGHGPDNSALCGIERA